MKMGKIISLIITLLLIIVGAAISVFAFSMMNFDYRNLSTVEMVTSTYTIEGDIRNISIDEADSDIRFAVSEDGKCRVQCTAEEGISHYAELEGDTLVVKQKDERELDFYIWIKLESNETVIYLPEGEYNELAVNTASGDVDIPDGFSFARTEIDIESGDVKVEADVYAALSVQTSSGNIDIRDKSLDELTAKTSSGNICIENIEAEKLTLASSSGKVVVSEAICTDIYIDSISGDITLKNVTADESIKLKSSSGNIKLKKCDAYELDIETSSGDVSGTLQTEKMFTASSSSGDVDVPDDSALGGNCRIKTSSGDIDIKIVE